MRHFFTRLWFRLILLVFLAVLPALGLTLYSGLEQRRMAVEEATRNVQDLVIHASVYQERVVEDIRQLLLTLAELPMVRQQDGPACSALFARIMEKQPIYGNISAINLQGLPFATALPQSPRSQLGRSHFAEAVKTRSFSIGEYGIGRGSGKPTIHFGYPIINNGVVQGVVSASLDLSYLNALVAKTRMPAGGMLTIIDRDGTVLARHPQPEQWVGKRMPEVEIVKIVLDRKEGVVEASGIDGVTCLFAFSPLGEIDLFVFAGIPVGTISATADRILKRNLLALGAALVLALALAWLLGKFFLINRTRALVKASRRLTGGDLKTRSGLSYQDGEFGQLAQSFDDMAATLEQRQAALRESEARYRALVENINLGITLIGSDHKIIMTNVGQGRLFDKDPGEFVGKYCFEEFEKRQEICPNCPGARTMATGQPAEIDTVGVHDDGTFHYAHVRTYPSHDSQGNINGFIELVEDTTARRQAEVQLAWVSRVNSSVAELSRALLASRSLEDIAHMVMASAMTLTGSSLGYCGYLDPQTGHLIVPTMSREVWEVCQVPDKNIIFKEFKGLWGYGLLHRQPVLSNNLAGDPRSAGLPPGHMPINNFISVPAMIGPEILGQVAIANAPRDYTPSDQEACEGLALAYALSIQRHRDEEALRRSEARYRLLAENVRDVIWTMDLNQRLTYISPSVKLLTGFTPEELQDMEMDRMFTPASLKAVKGIIAEILAPDQPDGPKLPRSETLDFECRCKDGSAMWVEIHAATLHDAEGQLTGFQGISRDITKRRQMVEALRESEKRFRDITDNASEWVWEVDAEGKYLYSSPVVERLLGYKPEEVLGKRFFDFVVPEDQENLREAGLAIFKSREPFRDLINCNRHKNGETVWLSSSGVPVVDVQGALLGYRGADIDITERRKSQAALENANIQLQALVREAEYRNSTMALLNDMSEMLQTCQTSEEACSNLNRFMPKFFPTDAGALYLLRNSKNLLSTVTTWGHSPPTEEMFPPDHCWALRSGRVHVVENSTSALLCKHINPDDRVPADYLCVPLMAQGISLGILHIRFLSCATHGREVGDWEAKRRLAVAIAENLALSLANVKLRETLQNQAIRDPLTGLFNRRYLEETMERELHRARRLNTPIGVVMMDLDHFKEFNDGYGHGAGDALLSALAHVLTAGIRSEDIACRYGGEEFLLVMPGAALTAILERAEQVRQAVKALQVKYQGHFLKSTTISLGVAIFPDQGNTAAEVIAAADAALYRAKHAGRDRVEVAALSSPRAAAS